MNTSDFYKEFKGTGTQSRTPHAAAYTKREPYLADPELVRALRLAIFLNRPLLLEGDPGCGKTRLAYAVAYELGIPIERWNITSGSRAKDGLYTYDAVRRLHDVQLAKLHGAKSFGTERDPSNAMEYITLGAIGKAFQRKDVRTVVLIDEIDKADVDFANDLLNVIDKESRITIEETGKELAPAEGFEPIYIITSNREKGNLPDPFLRRCLFKYIEFPDDQRLKEIVREHQPNETPLNPELLEAAVARLGDVRKLPSIQKKPGTSEFIDWFRTMEGFSDAGVSRAELPKRLRTGELPFPETLIKIAADLRTAMPAPKSDAAL